MLKYIIKTKIGLLEIRTKNNLIYSSKFVGDDLELSKYIDEHILRDINNYFNMESVKLKSKIKLIGTTFQIKVWKQICRIPYGSTITYSELAEAIGEPKAIRAVANACSQNRIALFVPCHRVVGKNDVGGYRWDIYRKEILLSLELCQTI